MLVSSASSGSSPPVLPHWAGPKLDPLLPHGGVPYTEGATFQRLLFATPATGTYNHMPMVDEHEGRLFAWWKNSPKDEDQPGEQRILSSQSADGVSWSAAAELFPKLPAPHVLFAEPMLHVNNRSAYIAASPYQFNVYPIADQVPGLGLGTLLLRQVNVNGSSQFGPAFWATTDAPPGLANASTALGIRTVDQMPLAVREDVNQVILGLRTCPDPKATGNWKCEWCRGGGCLAAADRSQWSNEFTHYEMPGGRGGDVVLIRRSYKKLSHLSLGGSVRAAAAGPNGTVGNWSAPAVLDIPDDNGNLNAGALPDGRVFLLSNAMPNAFRDPLFLTASVDGLAFGADTGGGHTVRALTACEQDMYRSLEQPLGCVYRHGGGSKQGGVQYPQGLALTTARLQGFWAIYSLNKEDIWLARVPFSSIP